jgi:hypothetical protein
MDRDVRLTERQLWHGAEAVRRRRNALIRQLERSSYASKPGMKESVQRELVELHGLLEILEHNHRAIGRNFAERLNSQARPAEIREANERADRADRNARLNAIHTGTYKAGE